MEASTSLSFLLLLGHGPVSAGHWACSVFCFLFFALGGAVEGPGSLLSFLFLYLC
ncbi:hypothetical protein HanHA300_Chr07g0231381 [Helianthus annuus]|nr:hypothetical protein HanHA300_Chr07g0231381 [Helianthus annuus]KAJ0562202.1 hypothetical protein HanHA89_Chr07g0248541 [Helianthus annuus]KAJ0727576.1 hypothetical protein HanLR1_Chr07g0231341 [Helianthus annuus]